jgi:hypothetical protein
VTDQYPGRQDMRAHGVAPLVTGIGSGMM